MWPLMYCAPWSWRMRKAAAACGAKAPKCSRTPCLNDSSGSKRVARLTA